MGVSYTELRRFDRGLREHIMDFEDVSKEPVLLDNKSRALENMGKVYAKMGNYTKGTKRVFKCEGQQYWLYVPLPQSREGGQGQ